VQLPGGSPPLLEKAAPDYRSGLFWLRSKQ
jgi:hypothetical protein